jgi:hypothetical protein
MEDKSDKNKNKASFLFSNSLIFDEDIDKLWLYLRDMCAETSNIDFLDNFKYIKGDNTWTIGNKFSLYWVGVCNFEIKCKSIKIDRMKKQIRWKLKMDIGIDYYKQITLYRITQNNKTLVKTSVYIIEEKNNLIDARESLNYYIYLYSDILIKQSKYLQNLKKDIISYRSGIINKNYIKVWKNLHDFNKLNELSPNPGKNIEFKGQINKVGSFVKFYDQNSKQIVFFKISAYDMSENKKQWLMRFETIGSNYHNFPKKTEIKIIRINENKTQISFLHQFSFDSDRNFINEYENKKNESIKKVKEYIENNDKEFIITPKNEFITEDLK